MKYLSFVLVLLSLIAGPSLCPLAALAEGNGWVSLGPPGGLITELRVHPRNPQILWAGAYGAGVFRSTDGGTSWSPANQGLDRLNVQALAVASSDPRILYAASGGRFYRSANSGQSWTVRLPCGSQPGCLPLQVVLQLVVDPRDPQAVFAVTFRGLFKSLDGGAQWRRVALSSRSITTMAFEPGNPKVAYAAGYNEFFKSTNGGASWALWSRQSDNMFEHLVIDSKNPRRMWSGRSSILLRSTDGGRSWRRLDNSPYQLTALALTPAAGAGLPILWAGSTEGIFRSLDGGATWKVTLRSQWVNFIATHPQAPDTLWIAGPPSTGLRRAPQGVFKSVDRGATWMFSSRGIVATELYSLAFDPVTPGVLWTTAASGVWRSADGGSTWTEHSQGIPRTLFTQAVAVDPNDAETVWVGTSEGVFISEDGGATWVPRRQGLTGIGPEPYGQVVSLWFALGDSSIAYAGTPGKIFRTVDAGRNWAPWGLTLPASALPQDFWIDPRDSNVLFAAGRGLWVSRDGGASWNEVPGVGGDGIFGAIEGDPRNPDVLYAAGDHGAFRSTDGGQSWQLVADLPLTFQARLAVGPDGEVWIGGLDGIYFSPDGVADWVLLPGLAPYSRLPILAADPHHPGTVFAGAYSITGTFVGLLRHTED